MQTQLNPLNVVYKKFGTTLIVVDGSEIINRNISEAEWIEFQGLLVEGSKEKIDYFLNPILKAKALEEQAKAIREAEEKRIKEFTNMRSKRISKRISDVSELFTYDEEGQVFLKDSSIPMPQLLCEAILSAKYNPHSKYTLNSLINFWKWCLLNPNPEAREDLFKWFQTGEFVITESGNIVAYRCVDVKNKQYNPQEAAITAAWTKVKSQKKSPKNYYFDAETSKLSQDPAQGINLQKLYESLTDSEAGTQMNLFTDHHTRSMEIRIGQPVTLDRSKCDSNRNASCSSGLHFMSLAYDLRYGEVPLIILINPRNIVAFPAYDQTKGRCCEYFPVGIAEKDENGRIVPLDNATLDYDYNRYSTDVLEDLFKNHSLQDLKDSGEIAEDITEEQIEELGINIKELISKRVIKL